MSCMEHSCTECNWSESSNSMGPEKCPECNSPVFHQFDEEVENGRNWKITGEEY